MSDLPDLSPIVAEWIAARCDVATDGRLRAADAGEDFEQWLTSERPLGYLPGAKALSQALRSLGYARGKSSGCRYYAGLLLRSECYEALVARRVKAGPKVIPRWNGK